jgi:hypothetical protein
MRGILKSSAVLLAIFGGLAQAVDVVSVSDASSSTGYCGDSTFINQSSGGSPLISDCETLRQSIIDTKLAYSFAGYGNGHYIAFDSYGTCTIGFSCQGPFGVYRCLVDWRDARDLITSSIDRFSWESKVGAKGQMPCLSIDGADRTTYWGLYHS